MCCSDCKHCLTRSSDNVGYCVKANIIILDTKTFGRFCENHQEKDSEIYEALYQSEGDYYVPTR